MRDDPLPGPEEAAFRWELVRLDGVRARLLESQIAEVYATTFATPPYSRNIDRLRDHFHHTFSRYRLRPTFQGVVARTPEGEVVGLAYGYRSEPGQWWHDHVASALTRAQRADWLRDAFELAEFAVRPAWQGRGIGTALHDALLRDLPQRTALLSTLDVPSVARRLYERRGWQTLVAPYAFGPGGRPYRIMGRRLTE